MQDKEAGTGFFQAGGILNCLRQRPLQSRHFVFCRLQGSLPLTLPFRGLKGKHSAVWTMRLVCLLPAESFPFATNHLGAASSCDQKCCVSRRKSYFRKEPWMRSRESHPAVNGDTYPLREGNAPPAEAQRNGHLLLNAFQPFQQNSVFAVFRVAPKLWLIRCNNAMP